jgi:AcrR family transcriptional regulator
MVEAVYHHGFEKVTVQELVESAGVSKRAFYQCFQDKRDCFLAAHEGISAFGTECFTRAYCEPGDLQSRLRRAYSALLELIVAHPAEARLAIVDSLTLGAAAVQPREQAVTNFELLVRAGFGLDDPPYQLSALTARTVVAGTRTICYRHLRTGTQDVLPRYAEPIVDWALSYRGEDSEDVREAVKAAEVPRLPSGKEANAGRVGWDEPPSSTISRGVLSPRERIARATARLVAQDGFEAVGIPAISAEAGTSNRAFYEQFDDKRDAFLAAFEAMASDALSAVSKVFLEADSRAQGVGAGLRALLEYTADHDLFARLAYIQLPTAGLSVVDRAEWGLDSFASLFTPVGHEESGAPLVKHIQTGVAGGIWTVIQHEIARDRGWMLPALAPELTRIAMKPFSGAAGDSRQ